MAKELNLECLDCGSKFRKIDQNCPNCGAHIKSMIPQKKPNFVAEPDNSLKNKLTLALGILLYTFCIPIGLFSMLEIPIHPIIILFIEYIIIYIIVCLVYVKKQKKYVRYQKEMKLYRAFVVSEIEEYRQERESKEQFEKEIERLKQITEENLNYELSQKYGYEISRLNISSSEELILYNEYLVYISCNRIKKDFDLNGFIDCELINSKMDNKIYIFLKEPSTQSKVDAFFNGKDGINITVDNFLKTCSEKKKNEINSFFIKLKKNINKHF